MNLKFLLVPLVLPDANVNYLQVNPFRVRAVPTWSRGFTARTVTAKAQHDNDIIVV